MEITKQVHKVQTPPKTILRADANRDSHVIKIKVVESALPTNTARGCADKHNTKKSLSPSKNTTGADKTYFLNGPGHSSEECEDGVQPKTPPFSTRDLI